MGRFGTEAGLLFDGNIKNAFSRARLLTAGISNEANVCVVLKRYVLTQLVFMPGGSVVKFDYYLISAYQALRHVLSGDDVIIDCIPPCLYTKLQQHVSEGVKKYVDEQQLSVVRTTLEDLRRKGFTGLPSLVESSQHRASMTLDSVWNGEGIVRGSTQTEESFQEQQTVTDLARMKLDKYVDANQRAVRNTIVCGGPGNGKTTCCTEVVAIMAVSRGLIVTMTALMSVRAKQLGGRHISHLLCIPLHEYATPQRLAELAVMKLFRMPKLMAFLRQLDVMSVDELSLVSDKY